MYKLSFKIIAFLIYAYGCAWAFNHVNAWIGIAMAIAMVIYLADKFYTYIKSQNND